MKGIEELYEAYYETIYDWFYWRCVNDQIAMDLTQDTFLQVMTSLHRFKENCSDKTWIIGIAKHVWIDYLRKKKVEIEYDEAIADRLIEEVVDLKTMIEQLKIVNEKQYDVIRYRLQGYSHKEIAQKMNCSEASVRVLFHRAKKWLKDEIERSEQHDAIL